MKKNVVLGIAFFVCGMAACFLFATGKKAGILHLVFLLISSLTFLTFANKERFLTKKCKSVLLVAWMGFLLTYNYSSNAFNPKNTMYGTFQWNSESLVLNMINARNDGVKDTGAYGLGWYDVETKTTKPYQSQYGLQGKFFQAVHNVPGKHIFCYALTALVFSLLVLLLRKKYNALLAFCFFATFLLSPWIVNFARNLYWVEFTWFVPMLLGLLCSLHRESRKIGWLCAAGVGAAVFVKSLCGYEYLTVIMLSTVAFLCVDAVSFIANGDRKNAALAMTRAVLLGAFAFAGFCAALLLHARLRGDGSLAAGLNSIYRNDVLRRTLGGNPADFAPVYKDSLAASVLTVLRKYYVFYTELVSGVPGRFFLSFSILPLLIFAYKATKNRLNVEHVALYAVFYITCISWFVFGKSHSYIHTGMNYVLWYFGFVQVCFYVILEQALAALRFYLPEIKRQLKETVQ